MAASRLSLRSKLAAGAAAVLLAACGGGELLLLTIVTPLNGAWRLNDDVAQEGITIQSPDGEAQLFSSQYDVTANLLNPVDFCGAQDDGSGQLAMVGRYDNGRLTLRAADIANRPTCIDGTITSLIRFDAVATGARPARFYINRRVEVRLDLGLWVSEGGRTQLKFSSFLSVDNDTQDSPIRACDVSPGQTAATLDGVLDGFQSATATRPRIDALTEAGQAAPRYTAVEFVDGATLTLRTAAGQSITLKRQRETTPSTCN